VEATPDSLVVEPASPAITSSDLDSTTPSSQLSQTKASLAAIPVTGYPLPDGGCPDEVTLDFGTVLDPSGRGHPLSESLVLASILCAVDAERASPTFPWSGPGEVVEAIAPVYWPFLVLPSPTPGHVVFFDGTGVGNQTFQRSRMPPVQSYPARLANPPASPELPAWFRGLRDSLLPQGSADSMTVSGLLPVRVPYFAEFLKQSGVGSDPSAPRAAFLPTLHPVAWYEPAVTQIGQSVEQFDADSAELSGLRSSVDQLCRDTSARLDSERRQLHLDLTSRSRLYATEEMEGEIASVYGATRDQIHAELERIQAANVAIAEARASARVAEILAQRAASRREDASGYRTRIHSAVESERRILREIREAHGRIASLHEWERGSFAVLTDRVAVVEQHAADELSRHELLCDDVAAAGRELQAALDAQIARRRVERDQLAGHLVALSALEGVRTVWFPLWIATLVGPNGARSLVFPPMRLRGGMGPGDSIRTLWGGIVLPMDPRTAQFGQGLRTTFEETIRGDPWLSGVVRQIVRAADATSDPAFLKRLAMGLQELRQAGWISPDQEPRLLAAATQHLRARPTADPSTAPSSVGEGTTSHQHVG
jgi:hypothetical protein